MQHRCQGHKWSNKCWVVSPAIERLQLEQRTATAVFQTGKTDHPAGIKLDKKNNNHSFTGWWRMANNHAFWVLLSAKKTPTKNCNNHKGIANTAAADGGADDDDDEAVWSWVADAKLVIRCPIVCNPFLAMATWNHSHTHTHSFAMNPFIFYSLLFCRCCYFKFDCMPPPLVYSSFFLEGNLSTIWKLRVVSLARCLNLKITHDCLFLLFALVVFVFLLLLPQNRTAFRTPSKKPTNICNVRQQTVHQTVNTSSNLLPIASR